MLAEEGRISKAYNIAQLIRKPSFRYSAYQSIINKLIDAKKIPEANKILAEIPIETSNLAYANALIKIYKVAPNLTIKNRIVSILNKLQSQTSARREPFWESSMLSIAYSWAELGERQAALTILRDTELGFYKESTFDEFKKPIESLVKQNQDHKIYKFIIGIPDITAKCYTLIALASFSSREEKQKLLLESESLAANIPSDNDQSFAYSAIAKEWADIENFHYAIQLSNQCRSFDKVYVYLEVLSKILEENS